MSLELPFPTSVLAPEALEFLRSINVPLDARTAERIAHFQPTSKSVALVSALLKNDQERAWLVVAPYGSGKSLAAAYALQLVENRPEAQPVLRMIEKRLASVDSELAVYSRKRRQRAKRGIAIALQGHVPVLGTAFKASCSDAMARMKLGREARSIRALRDEAPNSTIALLAELQKKAREIGLDRVLILWDEFGRHVESLLANGTPEGLAELQLLAEFVSRSGDVPITLCLFAHQELSRYTLKAAQTVRVEWAKVEGRFRTAQYIDDSKEILRLIGRLVGLRAPQGRVSPKELRFAVRRCRELELFRELGERDLEDLIAGSYPLEPVTLHLLPRISARAGQHERTLFTFALTCNMMERLDVASLYDYFSPAMQADISVGGAHRRWIETESALSKVAPSSMDARVLKTACLLGLGTSGERARVRRDVLLFAMNGYEERCDAASSVDGLVERKLLLARKHADDVTVWHGTDIDLRRRLEEQRAREREQFDLVGFLAKEIPPPVWRPTEYNSEFYIRRFLPGEYRSVREVTRGNLLYSHNAGLPLGSDGKVVYVLAETNEELIEAQEQATKGGWNDRVVIVVPREPIRVREIALDVWCLLRMQHDPELMSADPLAASEIQQLIDDARMQLEHVLARLTQPGPHGGRWHVSGECIAAGSVRTLRRELSRLMSGVFGRTPKINSEMLVRNRPTPVVINARKKVIMGILERTGRERLGLEGNFADSAILRTVLVSTGLYRRDKDRWRWARVEEVPDEGLREVWGLIRAFLTTPSDAQRDFGELIGVLREPPYGVRVGLLPVLIAAGMAAFPGARSLTKEGAYVPDVLPSEIEDLVKEPGRYRLAVKRVDQATAEYLRGVVEMFGEGASDIEGTSDLVRAAFDAICAWRSELSPAATTARELSPLASRLRDLLLESVDPMELMFGRFPALASSPDDWKATLEVLRQGALELDAIPTRYEKRVREFMTNLLSPARASGTEPLCVSAPNWAACFSREFVSSIQESVARSLVVRLAQPYSSDRALIDSVASLMVGKSLDRWEESTVALFERGIADAIHRVEELALGEGGVSQGDRNGKGRLAGLVERRLHGLVGALSGLIGTKETARVLRTMAKAADKG